MSVPSLRLIYELKSNLHIEERNLSSSQHSYIAIEVQYGNSNVISFLLNHKILYRLIDSIYKELLNGI